MPYIWGVCGGRMPNIDLGIDESEWKPSPNEYYFENMLYYGTGKLTDTYYCKNVRLYKNGKFVNKGQHTMYVLAPEVQVGDYLTTCPVKGVAMKTNDLTAAFAKVIRKAERAIDKPYDLVLKAYVEFL